jgi:LemA protein
LSQKKWLIIIVTVLIIAVPLIAFVVGYNHLVSLDISCDQEWSQVQVQYQRRYDLIPRVVNATKLYINYEQSLLMAITEARSRWAEALSQSVESQASANAEMDSVMSRLLAVVDVEAYPDLKANQVVLGLIDELEGTENRISVARMRYNEAVASYNGAVRMIPTNLIAGMMGLSTRPYFAADWEAETAPPV